MKKLLVLLSAISALSFISPATADAGNVSYRLTGCTPCGLPIYAYFHVHGYNSCGQPVGHWVTQYPASCGCNSVPICKPVSPSHNLGGHHHNHGQQGISSIQIQGSGWGFKVVK